MLWNLQEGNKMGMRTYIIEQDLEITDEEGLLKFKKLLEMKPDEN